MHNFWFEILVDGGVILFLAFMGWYFLILLFLWKIMRKSKVETLKYYSKSIFYALLFFLITAMSASSVIYFFPMWIALGLAVAIINLSKNEENKTVVAC